MELIWTLVKNFIVASDASFNVSIVTKIAEERFNAVSKEKMHAHKKIEEEYPKLEPVIDEMSEQFIVNVEAGCDNGSSDTESTSDEEMSGVDPLDN
jgi:hypothetical protein